MRHASAIIVLVAFAALAPVAGTARQATPPPGAEAPGPEECRVPLRSTEAILSVLATPAAEPGAAATDVPAPGESRRVASQDEFPTGEPADAATAAAVEAVVRELTACNNANDFIRSLSLVSDDLLRAFLQDFESAAVEADLATAAATQPTPRAEGDRTVILAIRDARVFRDRRVGVVVVTNSLNDEDDPNLSLAVLVQTAEGWLVDASVMVDPEAAGS